MFTTGTDANGRPTAERVPPNTVLIQFVRAAPTESLITVSPTVTPHLYTLQELPRLARYGRLNQKTVKKYMYEARVALDRTGRFEGPSTIMLALSINESNEDLTYTAQKAAAICKWLHAEDQDITNALHTRAKQIMGLAKVKQTYDPFEL